jgi:hypothetical protein
VGGVGLTTLLPSVSRSSRQCGILNILQPCSAIRPVTGIALLYFYNQYIVMETVFGKINIQLCSEKVGCFCNLILSLCMGHSNCFYSQKIIFLRAASCCVYYYNLFGDVVIRNSIFRMFFFITITYPAHVLAEYIPT